LLKWVVNSVNSNAVVQSIRQLHGGTSSTVHIVSLLVNQDVREFVLRQFDNAEWLYEEPDLALHEAKSLLWASRINLETPKIIAFDETGSISGVPAVLMTKLEGSIILKPQNIDNWLNGLAESLVRIHAVEAEGYPWTYFTHNNISSLETPSWSNYPELWNRVFDIVKGPRAKAKECFIHRDYHPTNVLWDQDKVSGVIDWVNACRGPAGIDVGHCRLNLAQLFDVQTADQFLSAYQKHAEPEFNYDPYWDLLSLIDILFGPPKVYPGWEAFGVTELTDKLIEERLDKYMISLLERTSRLYQ
jgi:aminoglycoside phosphotransferase (APT) family kinase protein